MAAGQESISRQRAIKASVIGPSVGPSSSIQEEADAFAALWSEAGVVDPPYDPEKLIHFWENSSCLNQNVDAYQVNVDGLGHRLVARVDFTSAEAAEKVRDGMWMERIREAEGLLAVGEQARPGDLLPTDEDVAERIADLKLQARLERLRLESFLEYAYPDGSFESLRTKTRHDLEITGNAYWEVLRDRSGQIARFVHVPPAHMKCTSLDSEATSVDELVRVGFSWSTVRQHRFFRRYVQRVGTKLVWFKAFGDPRVVSRTRGDIYEDAAAFDRGAASGDVPASELVHFKVYASGEAYGIPRWIGTLMSVLGSTKSDRVNYAYFDNKAIPPLAILVSGGFLKQNSVDAIRSYMNDIKGEENFYKLLLLEAEGATDAVMSGQQTKIKFEKFADVQQGDALFQKYDERNIDKVGSSFRMPRLLRGDVRDFNRSTALTALRFADEQVFDPERKAFDSWMNRVILPALNIVMWTFRSKGPQTRDPERLADIVLGLADRGLITPNEGRELASEILGKDLDPIEAAWARQPLQLTLAGFAPPPDAEEEVEASDDDSVGNTGSERQLVDDGEMSGRPAAGSSGTPGLHRPSINARGLDDVFDVAG